MQFFGNYLVERGIVSAHQVLEALDRQRAQLVLIGQIARREGKLSEAQVFEVLSKQRQSGKSFGYTAVELGLLNQQEVNQLLKQQMARAAISEILVEMGVVERAVMDKELKSYRQSAKQ